MTAAQKIAKEKFKKAIAYRQKTGVSLKEAFAHVYGKKTVTKKPTKYKSKLTKKWNPIKPTDNVKELKKYGYQLKGVTKKSAKKVGKVTLKKANYHPRDERYIIMNDGVAHLEAKPFFKSDATRIAKALRQVKAKRNKVGVIKRKTAKKKKLANKVF